MNSCKEINKKVDESEQWLLQGNCDLCRKNKYCSKYCKAKENYVANYARNRLQQMIMNKFFGGKK